MSDFLTKQAGRFSETMIDDEVVLLNLDTGTFFSLTGTAAEIWPLIDGEQHRSGILVLLTAKYDAAPETIDTELDRFLAQLIEAGFITHGRTLAGLAPDRRGYA